MSQENPQVTHTLAVDDIVEVPVKFTIKSKGIAKLFSFSYTATRLSQDEINARLEKKDDKTKDFMAEIIIGWSGQRLVLDAGTNQPSDFGPEALAAMLNAPGVATVFFNAYLRDCGATAKN